MADTLHLRLLAAIEMKEKHGALAINSCFVVFVVPLFDYLNIDAPPPTSNTLFYHIDGRCA